MNQVEQILSILESNSNKNLNEEQTMFEWLEENGQTSSFDITPFRL